METCETSPTIVASKGGHLSYQDLTIEGLKRRFLAVCDMLPEVIDHDAVAAAKDAIQSWCQPPTKLLGYKVGGHATITPNLLALAAAGFDDMVLGRFRDLNRGTKPYIDQIVQTTQSIFDVRRCVGDLDADRIFPRPPDINLYAPAVYPGLKSLQPPKDLDRTQKRRFQLVKNAIERQPGYNFALNTDAQAEAMLGGPIAEIKDNPEKVSQHWLMRCRQLELALGTDCLGAVASSEISAVIRLPNDINRTCGLVRQFSTHYRTERPASRKRLTAFRQVQNRLAKAFPKEFVELVKQSRSGVRIIADAHVEWLDVDGLPLCIRKNVSRIPVTPGNLFVDQLLPAELLRLKPESFREVLVVCGLKRTDPIRNLFAVAFGVFEEHWAEKLSIKYVEVAREHDLVTAFNAFSGPMVIFDGHGSHEPNEAAKLHLQDASIDIWDLKNKVQSVPPIVILSACDTHAADRNHATTANGFLSLGARAVLGSVFPLDARLAAIFTARLLYRISSFIPSAITVFDQALTWTEVVSGMLRMQLLTEFLRRLEDQGVIDADVYNEVHFQGNTSINSREEMPFDVVLELLGNYGIDRKKLEVELEYAVANSSVISYLHVGRPETILIDSAERIADQLQEA